MKLHWPIVAGLLLLSSNANAWIHGLNVPLSLTITGPADSSVVQRSAGATTSNASISGTYTGGSPTGIQCQILLTSNSSVVIDWTSLTATSINGGTWIGGIASVPQGGKYFAKCRATNAQSVVGTGANNWYVGIVIVMYGQSNMQEMSTATSSPPAANSGTQYFNGTSWGAVPAANGVRELLNDINTSTSVPVGALNGSVVGVPIEFLVPGQSAFNNLASQLSNATNNDAECIVFMQGEGNAAGSYTQEGTYISEQASIQSQLATNAGRTLAQMPMFVAGLATTLDVSTELNWTQVQRTQIDSTDSTKHIYYSHSNIDAVLSDTIHYTAASYQRAGARYAQAFKWYLGLGSGLSSWSITSASVVDSTHTDITVTHAQGTDFTPTTGITGFMISNDNGNSWVTPSAAVRQSSTSIRITHSSMTNTRQVTYMAGADPDNSSAVVDNSSINAPLNPSAGVVIVTGTGQKPVPTFERAALAAHTTGNTWVASGIAIGPAFSTRLLVGVVTGVYTAALSSATVTPNTGSPVSATIVNAGTGAAVFQAVVPTGVYADVSATFGAAIFNSPSISIWYVDTNTMISTASVGSGVGSATSNTAVSLTLLTNSGGFIISGASSNNVGSSNGSTTGVASGDETYTTRPNSGANLATQSTADSWNNASSASSNLTWTYGITGNEKAAAASWN